MSLFSRIKGLFKSEGVTIDLELVKAWDRGRDMSYKEISREIDRLTQPLSLSEDWVKDMYLKPKPSHVENYLGAYGSNRWVG